MAKTRDRASRIRERLSQIPAEVAGRVISHSQRLTMRMGAHGQGPRDLLCGYERDLAIALA